jgi:regulator of protease activity HflC (stomatin/prohibitin superfamily)
MKKILSVLFAGMLAMSLSGCYKVVDSGKVGLRVNFNKTIEQTELQAGSFNQTMVGSVIEFPIKEISVDVTDLTPLASDNSTMSDFDVSVVYSIAPNAVSDLYINKNRTFHALDDDGELHLMHTYLKTTVRNAVYKVSREYEALKMNDSRAEIEQKILHQVKQTLAEEKLDNAVLVTQVQVKSIAPSKAITEAANNLVKAKSELAAKEIEVQTAKRESERMASLANNAGQSIAYMSAQANLMIAEGIRDGKVHTIVVPVDFKGIVNTGK